jgi:hypothetical protein
MLALDAMGYRYWDETGATACSWGEKDFEFVFRRYPGCWQPFA